MPRLGPNLKKIRGNFCKNGSFAWVRNSLTRAWLFNHKTCCSLVWSFISVMFGEMNWDITCWFLSQEEYLLLLISCFSTRTVCFWISNLLVFTFLKSVIGMDEKRMLHACNQLFIYISGERNKRESRESKCSISSTVYNKLKPVW